MISERELREKARMIVQEMSFQELASWLVAEEAKSSYKPMEWKRLSDFVQEELLKSP